jgi:putative ABC transport system substrate-binding protein
LITDVFRSRPLLCTIHHLINFALVRVENAPVVPAVLDKGRPVTVLAAVGGYQTPRAVMAATSMLPIVFGIGEDPVKEGLVPNLNRPAGNITGATFFTALLGAKRLGLLRELAHLAS